MRIIIAAAITLALAGSAYAQSLNLAAPDKKKDPLKQMQEEDIDRAYRQATQGSNQGVVNAPTDPWASVRAHEQPAKPVAKPAPKSQTAARTQSDAQAQPRQAPAAQQQSQSPWPSAPAPAARPQSQAQSQPANNSPWPPAPAQR